MDGIIINELSLNGQFLDSRDFWKNGMPPFHKALQDAFSHGVGYLFKQGSFFAAQATPDKTLHDLLTAPETRIIDEPGCIKVHWHVPSVIRFGMKLPNRIPMPNIQ